MRIALVNTFTPYIRGGAEIVVDDLEYQLRLYGHEVINFRIPFPSSYENQLITTIESTRMLCFDEFDKVIAFKFPAYCIKHNTKVIWLFHQFRQIYDLWENEFSGMLGLTGKALFEIIRIVDNENIPISHHVYTIGKEVSNRLMKYNSIESEVLPPPLRNHNLYYSEKYSDYFYYPSRITSIKRQHLAIEAMKYVKSGARLLLTGNCEDKYLGVLKKLIHENNLEKKVDLRNEWISEEKKRKLFANSLGVIFLPFKEDYGLVTLEAAYSVKPLITCVDSGEPVEYVTNEETGYIVPPDPIEIASIMDKLYYSRILAEQLGQAFYADILRHDINWDSTIGKLLA